VLLAKEEHLPPAGTLGVSLEPGSHGPRIASVAKDSASQAAGLERGDQIVSLNGVPIRDIADARLALWDKQPGSRFTLEVRRRTWYLATRHLSFEVTLR
jgi:S1-C subfamily serine protease